MEDITGQQLGAYRVIGPLGKGGMASVYKGYQAGMDRYVALKVLSPVFAEDPNFIARFQQEAKVLARLQHPHVLPVFDSGEWNGYTYIVMPYLKGGTLANLMRGEPLVYPQIRKVVTHVGDALDYAHSFGLVHRDVKPSNILIDERGNCLLSDFGLAKILEGGSQITSAGAIMGTPSYMSPEQGMGAPLDRRTDIYALGVILYEMAVGQVPFSAETPMAVIYKHVNHSLPPPSQVLPNFPEPLERAILKALEKNPEQRFQTAAQMVASVTSALDEIEMNGVVSPVGPISGVRGAAVSPPRPPSKPPSTPPGPAESGYRTKPTPQRGVWMLLGSFILVTLSVLVLLVASAFFLPRVRSLAQLLAPTATQTSTKTSTATPTPTQPTATPTITPTPLPVFVNVAVGKPVKASISRQFGPENAVDGSETTAWGSGTSAPQWIEVDLLQVYAIARIRLLVYQFPDGETEHRILGHGPDEDYKLLYTFTGFTGSINDTLEYTPPEPWQNIQVLRVQTVKSPSWAGWREVEVIVLQPNQP